jgi:predicted protein tyrosine phosphatase
MSGAGSLAPFAITICGIPELGGFGASGVSHVLSILDPDWPVPTAFGAFGEHHRLELRFHDVIEPDIPGMLPPQEEHVAALLAFGRDLMAGLTPDSRLVVHCHAGVSRSTAAMALILAQALPRVPAGRILHEVLRIRPQAWPNLRIVEMGDRLLSRGADLLAATHEIYRTQLRSRPDLAEAMREGGRGREVTAAEGRDG